MDSIMKIQIHFLYLMNHIIITNNLIEMKKIAVLFTLFIACLLLALYVFLDITPSKLLTDVDISLAIENQISSDPVLANYFPSIFTVIENAIK